MRENIYVRNTKLEFKGEKYSCVIGKGGIVQGKMEGDEATPAGCFPIREVFYRADRAGELETVLPTQKIEGDDGWCDDPEDENYNKHIKLPYNASYESLWREDKLYDIIVVLGYNDDPPEPGKGSAVFMHIARPEFSSTAGCIALAREDLLEVLKSVKKDTFVCVKNDK